MVSVIDCYARGLPFESGILPVLKQACGEQQPATKRLAGVAQEVDLRECTSHVQIRLLTLALKPRGDITRRTKQGYQ